MMVKTHLVIPIVNLWQQRGSTSFEALDLNEKNPALSTEFVLFL